MHATDWPVPIRLAGRFDDPGRRATKLFPGKYERAITSLEKPPNGYRPRSTTSYSQKL